MRTSWPFLREARPLEVATRPPTRQGRGNHCHLIERDIEQQCRNEQEVTVRKESYHQISTRKPKQSCGTRTSTASDISSGCLLEL